MAKRRKQRAKAKTTRKVSKNKMSCSYPHSGGRGLFATIVLVFGIVALLKVWGIVSQSMYDWIWPMLVIIIGAKMLYKTTCAC